MKLLTSTLANKSYIPALDGFRGLAILVVMISHYGLGKWIPGGFGVTLFFFISGFLITRLLLAEYDINKQIDLRGFYVRRVLRLYPALLLMVTLAIVFTIFSGCTIRVNDILSTLFYYRNYYMFYGAAEETFTCGLIYNITWSLAIEEHFYLIFPLFFIFLCKWPKVLGSVMLLVIIGSLLSRITILYSDDINEVAKFKTYYFTENRLDAIMYGCLVSLIIHHDKSGNYIKMTVKPVVYILSLLLLVFTFVYRDNYFRETFRYSLQGIALSVVIPATLYGAYYESIATWLSKPKLVLIGKFSYSLYLFHWVGLSVAEKFIGGERLNLTWLLTAVPLGLMLSIISYYWVEKPTARLRKKFGSTVETAPDLDVSRRQQASLS